MMLLHLRTIKASIVILFLLLGGATSAQEISKEEQVKAAFVYNIIQFTEWNASASPASPFIIGIAGEDPFGTFIDELVKGETVNGRPIVVKRFGKIPIQDELQVLFVSRESPQIVQSLLANQPKKNTLVISDANKFTQNGGHIRFFLEGDKLRFEINVASAKSANLNFSSKLLRLAKICCDN